MQESNNSDIVKDERTDFKKPDKRISNELETNILKALKYIILSISLIYILFPLYWLIGSSVKQRENLFSGEPVFIPSVTFEHYYDLLFHTEFVRHVLNSIIVGLGTMVLTGVLATLGGYGLARSQFSGKKTLARTVLFAYMFPAILIGIPLYMVFFRLNLLNSYLGLILAHTSITLPFCLWLMWQFFQTIPLAYEESAWINGASKVRSFKDIVLPMALPGVMAISIFTFAISWSDFTLSVILMTDSSMYTFPVGLDLFQAGTDQIHWGLLLSGAVIVLIPAFFVVYFLQKYIIQGFRIGR